MVVNQRKEIGKDGKSVSKPLPDAELKQISDLVKEAMGFNKDRGDTISVANAPFTVPSKGRRTAAWRDPEMVSLAKDLIKYGRLPRSSPICCSASCGHCSRPCFEPLPKRAGVGSRSTCLPMKRRRTPAGACSDGGELLEKTTRRGARTGAAGPATRSQHHQGMDGCQWQLTTASRRAPSC
ncbi:flagellar M-ring protein FliF C-terminal domain-containing protein [Candidatus Accumulibacter necessarius]|uniref:flagellar M-ring protein FliF C-terminal domain-containing protein n=1 Tax=Candidatus Accumulibacter necessarius TaxID=2954386 RepID=UPI003DA89794